MARQMSKAKKYLDYYLKGLERKTSYNISEIHLKIIEILENMNHKTLEDVKELIEKKLELMNEIWDESCGVLWNEKYKTLDEFKTELEKLKL